MNKYKLFIRKYNFMKKDYEVIERVVVTNDIYIMKLVISTVQQYGISKGLIINY
ncbi:MAG: hypothetical protein HFH08_05815 [Bacilli bacterium]|nr:hypothetical protein [Bacilli bacterium]